MKKLKLLPSILMLIACVAILCVGIFAVAPTTNSINGTITINSSNPEVIISAYYHNPDGSLNLNEPIVKDSSVRYGINIDIGQMSFDISDANSVEDLVDLELKVTFRLQNPGNESLGVYFSETEVTGSASSSDVITKKTLTTDSGNKEISEAILSDYSELKAKNESGNGSLDVCVTFKLLNYANSEETIKLNYNSNKLFLNIEQCNYGLLPSIVYSNNTSPDVIQSLQNPNKLIIYADGGISGIEKEAFLNNTDIYSVVIMEGITYILTDAFKNCINLRYVYLPNSLNRIADGVFSGCDNIQFNYVSGDNNLKYLGNDENPYLMLVGVNDTSVENVNISKSCRLLYESSLANCSNITQITIPQSIIYISQNVFNGCSKLNAVNITDLEKWCSNIVFFAATSNPLAVAQNLYLNGNLVTHLEIPNTITKINDNAFRGCKSIVSVKFPRSVKYIGSFAFYTCSKITGNIFIPNSVDYLGWSVFYACNSLNSLTIEKGTPKTFDCQMSMNGFYLNGVAVDYLQSLERVEGEDNIYYRQ